MGSGYYIPVRLLRRGVGSGQGGGENSLESRRKGKGRKGQGESEGNSIGEERMEHHNGGVAKNKKNV